jgi:hypothetical protein
MRQNISWGAIAFGIALAIIVGLRLDNAALTAIVGMACGLGAAIPTSVLVISAVRRRDTQKYTRASHNRWERATPSPPIVVLTPPGSSTQMNNRDLVSLNYPPGGPIRRRFSVIGENEVEDIETIEDFEDTW